jgi:hypothetical protein
MVEFVTAEATSQDAAKALEFLQNQKRSLDARLTPLLKKWSGGQAMHRNAVLNLHSLLWSSYVEEAEERFGKHAVAYVLGFCLH